MTPRLSTKLALPIFALALAGCAAKPAPPGPHAAARPTPSSSPVLPAVSEDGQLLPPGKAAGTFHLVCRGRVTFTEEPAYPVVVSLSNTLTGTVASRRVTDNKPFILEADLRPGSYTIESVPPENRGGVRYWPESAWPIHIDRDGRLWGRSATIDLVHIRELDGMSPGGFAIARTDQPVLTWPPVPRATLYRIEFEGGGLSQEFQTQVPRLELPKLRPPDSCEWELYAVDEKGHTLAHGFETFFPHGTDPAEVKRYRTPPATAPAARSVPAIGGFLGIRPGPMAVTKDPAKMQLIETETGRLAMTFRRGDEMISAIRVDEVTPGSPAIEAGLRPNDVIVAIDGKGIDAAVSDGGAVNRTFMKQIRSKPPGTTIVLTVRRTSGEIKIPVTLGHPPKGLRDPITRPATERTAP